MLISIRGPLQAGKTTSAYHLVNKFNFHRHAFADGVKIEVFDFLSNSTSVSPDSFPFSLEEFPKAPDFVGTLDKDKIKWCNTHKDKLRPLLQWWGTDYRRSQDIDYWVKKWREIVAPKLENKIDVVVDDCRFWNERYLISELKGIDVYIVRPDLKLDSHESEKMNSYPDQYTQTIIQNIMDEGFLQWQVEGIYYFNKYPMTMLTTLNGTKPNVVPA